MIFHLSINPFDIDNLFIMPIKMFTSKSVGSATIRIKTLNKHRQNI